MSVWVHSHRIRLLRYLDDWLVLASSEVEAKRSIQDLLSVCHSLGIVINEERSDLIPSQMANYLDMTIDTRAARIFPSLAQVEKFLSVVEETFCTMTALPAQLWEVVLGHLASLEMLFPHSRLRMRSLLWYLKTHWSPEPDFPSLPPGAPVPGGEGPPSQGGSIWDTRSRSTPVLGRVSVGVGRTPPRPCSVRGVVGAEVAAHQSSRNEGSVSGIVVISGVGRQSPRCATTRRWWLMSTSRVGRFPVPFARWPASF